MRKIRVAQIGTSICSHGAAVAKTILTNPDVFEFVGYALPENEKEKFKDCEKIFENVPEMTVEEILADESIEAVCIETEEIYLTKYAIAAAKAKKHIHMEKPGGLSLSEFEELISIVKKNKTVFHTGYMYRYNPAVKDLLSRVRNGELGDIVSVEAQMSCLHGDDWREWLGAFGKGGMLFFLGCHLIDLVCLIQGTPEKVIPLSKPTGKNGIDTYDYGMAVLEYPHGTSFVKTTDVEYGGFIRRQLVVTGTKQTVEIKPLEVGVDSEFPFGLRSEVTTYREEAWGHRGEHQNTPPYDRFREMLRSFAAYVRGEKENPYTYDYELSLYRLVLACCDLH